MRKSAAVLLIAAVLLSAPRSLYAWGFEAHRFIVERAIDLLPPEMRPFYDTYRVFLVEHCIDPDLWRSIGFDEEPPRHFLDLDAYGRYPFDSLPREYGAAIQKFGPETLARNGVLPWRTAEIYGRLVRGLGGLKDKANPFAVNDAKYFPAIVAHYISDAHVPFHAVVNFDGQLTKQHGIHSRFESQLFERYRSTLKVTPGPIVPIKDPRDFTFDALLASFRLAEPVLQADREAIGTRELYDGQYFDAFLAGSREILEGRLAESITAVASVWVSAWESAGRPVLPLEPPSTIRKTKRPDRQAKRPGQ